ncbi:MAG: outer membrane protein assembly factor BamB family protein [Planctomycetota bacterium]
MSVRADDWPTAQHDNRRTGYSAEKIDAARLKPVWSWRSPFPPEPAWHGPAKWDAWASIRNLPSMRSYDLVFHPTAAANSVFLASSVTDSVSCLNAATGAIRWRFTTDAPIRIAPSIVDGRVYFGSDDGNAYCVDAASGDLIWKFSPGSKTLPRILNNGRLISPSPCRTGVVVEDGVAWFGCGLVPWQPSFLCAVDAESGRVGSQGTFIKTLTGKTLEGSPALSSTQILFPQGRVAPQIFARKDGRDLGTLKKSGGGSIVVVTPNAGILHGPATDSRRGGINASSPQTLESIATYGRGNSLAVNGDRSFVLSDDELIASSMTARKVLFRVPCRFPFAIVGAGETLFAGGDGEVAAFSAVDGRPLWNQKVDGRAYGLAVANGRLLVSTDEGVLTAFEADLSPPANEVASGKSEDDAAEALSAVSAPEAIDDDRLLGRWVFQHNQLDGTQVRNLAGGLPAPVKGPLAFEPIGKRQALSFDGKSQDVQVAANFRQARLPEKDLTVAAWVRIDEPQTWGGIVGAIQDNGDFERGWLLGFRESKFSVALAGKEGNGRLTYLTANEDFDSGRWYHVAATYDGTTLSLYVNGELSATSTQQKGEIRYPPLASYEIAAYRDNDEHFRLRGALHEMRVYEAALPANEIARQYASLAAEFPKARETSKPEIGPWLQFVSTERAVVRWRTSEPCATSLELREPGSDVEPEQFGDETPKRDHSVTLSGLRRNRMYDYRLKLVSGGQDVESDDYECDTFFNYSLEASPSGVSASGRVDVGAVSGVLGQAIDRGLCVVVGLRDGSLLKDLAERSRYRVLAFDDQSDRVAKLRAQLHEEGFYGGRVTIHLAASFAKLPVVGQWANLVMSERPESLASAPEARREIERLLRPDGGVALLRNNLRGDDSAERPAFVARLQKWQRDAEATSSGVAEGDVSDDDNGVWLKLVRAPLTKSGEWSHLYGRPDNSAFSGESLGHAKSTSDLTLQWIGRPGPRYQSDRSGRKPSPLSTGGRLFLQGLNRMVAVDHFNGSILWSLEIPDFERFNMPRDCSNWCADRDHVYAVVRDRLWVIDAATGDVQQQIPVAQQEAGSPKETEEQVTFDWGFVAREGDVLIGSAVRSGSAWTGFWGKQGWYDQRSGPETFKICSDRLFARNPQTGELLWQRSGGVVLNSTITVSNGVVYFVESRNADVINDSTRRIGSKKLWQDQYLVAVDAVTGSVRWEKAIDTEDGDVAFYLSHSDGKLVTVASTEKKTFHIDAFSDQDGSHLWKQSTSWFENKGDHGKALSRPAIVGDRIFLRPNVLSLADGKLLDIKMPGGGCGTYACTTDALFFRAGNVTVWDSKAGKASAWSRLRPDCWLSTIPAGGMLLSPEGGGGCSCGGWLETSIGFIPAAHRQRHQQESAK